MAASSFFSSLRRSLGFVETRGTQRPTEGSPLPTQLPDCPRKRPHHVDGFLDRTRSFSSEWLLRWHRRDGCGLETPGKLRHPTGSPGDSEPFSDVCGGFSKRKGSAYLFSRTTPTGHLPQNSARRGRGPENLLGSPFFFTFTGRPLNDYEIENQQEPLDALIRDLGLQRKPDLTKTVTREMESRCIDDDQALGLSLADLFPAATNQWPDVPDREGSCGRVRAPTWSTVGSMAVSKRRRQARRTCGALGQRPGVRTAGTSRRWSNRNRCTDCPTWPLRAASWPGRSASPPRPRRAVLRRLKNRWEPPSRERSSDPSRPRRTRTQVRRNSGTNPGEAFPGSYDSDRGAT